jgi:hypothetical protein
MKKNLLTAAFVALSSTACFAKDLGAFNVGVDVGGVKNFTNSFFHDAEKEKNAKLLGIKSNKKEDAKFISSIRIAPYVEAYLLEDIYMGFTGVYNHNLKQSEDAKFGLNTEKQLETAGTLESIAAVGGYVGYDIYSDNDFTLSAQAGLAYRFYTVSKPLQDFLDPEKVDISRPFDIDISCKATYNTDIADLFVKLGWEYQTFSCKLEDSTLPLKAATKEGRKQYNLALQEKWKEFKQPEDPRVKHIFHSTMTDKETPENKNLYASLENKAEPWAKSIIKARDKKNHLTL